MTSPLSDTSEGADFFSYIASHTALFKQGGLLACNTAIFLGRIFPKIPDIAPNGAQAMMSFLSLAAINDEIASIEKSMRDFHLAYQVEDIPGMIETAVKVAVRGADLLLCVGTSYACCLLLSGQKESAFAFYAVMIPVGMVSWALSIALAIHDHHAALKLQTTELLERKVHELLNSYALDPDAVRLIRRFEHYSIQNLREMPLQENIEKRIASAKENTALIALGYVAMGVCRAYPQSVIQAAVTLGISALYFQKFLNDRYYLTK